jgi:6-pyruvoyltetrahydropterin/6-carboxytetrahydropterin synthase
MKYESTKIIELGSCAFRQWRADSHCKFIHGYRLVAKFWFECDKLDARNWVVDFGGLKELKKDLEHQFDHTLCIASDDPMLVSFRELHRVGAVDLRIMADGVGIERTAEWCFKTADRHVRELTNNRCWVKQVEVWEHEKNSAIAIAQNTVQSVVAVEEGFTNTPTLEAEKVNTVNAGINVSAGGQVDNTPLKNQIRPAPVGNKVTSGYSNLFAGTSWGK